MTRAWCVAISSSTSSGATRPASLAAGPATALRKRRAAGRSSPSRSICWNATKASATRASFCDRDMSIAQSLLAFTLAAGLLTITPGFDTILVLRTSTAEGAKQAALAGLGICVGCLCWGAIAAVGLGALLTASHIAYEALKLLGAAYLVWLGLNLVLNRRTDVSLDLIKSESPSTARANSFWRGLLG